jgi:hypothetical protein
MKMLIRVTLIFSGLIVSMSLAEPVSARVGDGAVSRRGLFGSAELDYVSYEATENGRKVLDASTFVQKYSLLYQMAAKARTEANGSYDLAVGYEWTSIDTSVSRPGANTDRSVRSGRLLYSGSFAINPPSSPFELSAYSRDMTRNTFSYDTLPELSDGNRIIAPNMQTDIISSGTNIESGVRLVIAEKRGRKQGAFGDLLVGVPAIYVNYWDMMSSNTQGGARLESHSNRFDISAGGIGDTWLHYQSRSHTDKYYPESNYEKTTILFGTINQFQRRKWIQFTNWIKLSADARFAQSKNGNPDANEEEFDLNIFGMATRRLWEAKVFTNYNRKIVGGGAPEEILRLPLYVSGVLGADTDWSLSVSATQHHTGGGAFQDSRSSEDNLSVRINTFKRSPFTLTSTVTLTNNSDSGGGGEVGADLNLETVSTSRFSRALNLAGGYALRTRYNRGSEQYSYNQDLLLSAYYQPSSEWKLSFRETITQGKNDAASTDFASSSVARGQNPLGAATNLSVPTSNFLRLATTAAVAWTPIARFTASLSGTNYMQYESGGTDSMSNAISAGLSYSQPTYNANLGGSVARQDNGDQDISLNTRVVYKPSRSIEASLRGQVNQRQSSGTRYQLIDAAQRLTYYIWGSRGISRKVADLYEEVAYIQSNAGETPRRSLTLAGSYYLYARISLNGRATYSLQNGDLSQAYGVGLAANMKLLDATVDYTYAKRSSDKRVENRLAATLKKSF